MSAGFFLCFLLLYGIVCVCMWVYVCCQSTEIFTRHLNTWNFPFTLLLGSSFHWQIAWCTDPFWPPFILCIERIHNVLYLIHEPKEIIWQPYKPGKCVAKKKYSIARSERYSKKIFTYLLIRRHTDTGEHTLFQWTNEQNETCQQWEQL